MSGSGVRLFLRTMFGSVQLKNVGLKSLTTVKDQIFSVLKFKLIFPLVKDAIHLAIVKLFSVNLKLDIRILLFQMASLQQEEMTRDVGQTT